MKRHVLIYGLIGGVILALLQWTEYRFLVIEHSVKVYAGLIAATFAALGIWLGLRFKASHHPPIQISAPVFPSDSPDAADPANPFVPDNRKLKDLAITPRELEVLQLIANGLSNREIAEALFVSENTVKTHSSRVLDKLGAKRRTQAVQLAKELRLLP
jgi:DNA-binding CsgD family transcriptional regulator